MSAICSSLQFARCIGAKVQRQQLLRTKLPKCIARSVLKPNARSSAGITKRAAVIVE